MTLDLNLVRADFAAYLGSNASRRHSLDAALMHVVEAAYQKGLNDALLVPAVLREPIADLDNGMADGNGSAAGAELAAVAPAGIPETAGGAGPRGSAEGGDATPAQQALKGGALAKLAGIWCNDPTFQAWIRDRVPEIWAANAARTGGEVGNIDHLIAGNCIRALVNVKTRADLDHNQAAAALFKRLILVPYVDHIKATQA